MFGGVLYLVGFVFGGVLCWCFVFGGVCGGFEDHQHKPAGGDGRRQRRSRGVLGAAQRRRPAILNLTAFWLISTKVTLSGVTTNGGSGGCYCFVGTDGISCSTDAPFGFIDCSIGSPSGRVRFLPTPPTPPPPTPGPRPP